MSLLVGPQNLTGVVRHQALVFFNQHVGARRSQTRRSKNWYSKNRRSLDRRHPGQPGVEEQQECIALLFGLLKPLVNFRMGRVAAYLLAALKELNQAFIVAERLDEVFPETVDVGDIFRPEIIPLGLNKIAVFFIVLSDLLNARIMAPRMGPHAIPACRVPIKQDAWRRDRL